VPGQVIGLSGITAIAAGNALQHRVEERRHVWAWGTNEFSQLGDATWVDRLIAAPIARLSGIKRIWCGQNHCFASDRRPEHLGLGPQLQRPVRVGP
jgi:alpha-tubulin suppressor-like RCC1 family protein